MKIFILIISLLALVRETLYSQSVIGSGANFSKVSNSSVFWTIGEFVSETIENNSNILTQGFYQSNLITSEVIIPFSTSEIISVFPNPAKNKLFINCNTTKDMSFRLLNVTGILLKGGIITNKTTLIQMDNITNGIYLLEIRRKFKSVKTFKIVKN